MNATGDYHRATRSADPVIWIGCRVVVLGAGCWEWTGRRHPNGYGSCERGDTGRMAHRAVWTALVGPIPHGLDLDHLCRNRACVNPDHLEPVTRSENLRRSPLVGRTHGRKTHCKNGHDRERSTAIGSDGRRRCRLCVYMWAARARVKARAR